MSCFVNFSNHPSGKWADEQIKAASVYGNVIDVAFPQLDVAMASEEIETIGNEYIGKIISYNPKAVMCQGEFTLCFYVTNRLMDMGIVCVSACTDRVVREYKRDDGSVQKESIFAFKGFREYVR